MLEWFVVGAIAIGFGQAILKGAKSRPPTPLLSAPKSSLKASAEERQNRLAVWRARWEPEIDRTRWIPSGTATRLLERHSYPVAPDAWSLASGRAPGLSELTAEFRTHNQNYLRREALRLKPFFDAVEKSPLTDEQIAACVCMDDNLLVVAAAGSGKTSTMVAKTGYVLKQGLARPDQVLLLAFNRDAADEMGRRIRDRLTAFPGIEDITARTFDAFGLSVIGKATGKKPKLAPWVSERGEDIAAVADIARALCSQDARFRQDWDLFRTVYGRDVGGVGEQADPEAFDGARRGFRTADGKVVKSKEERLIADWLFYNGVNYAYERAYEHDTADEQHAQYHPDFYYPDIDLYHEHFALDANGAAPSYFSGGYVDGVHWKRALHAEKRTALFETTSAEIRSNDALRNLEAVLTGRGLKLDFKADRKAAGSAPMTDIQLASTLRVFLQHVKSNGLSRHQLEQSAQTQGIMGHDHRLRLFLKLYFRFAQAWEDRLSDGGYIDFEDMLRLAADHIEAGRYSSPFTVILADEFQDSSRARVRLLQALRGQSADVHLTVVGDDWQGINRFAGADLRVMSEFGSFFSHAATLKLATTFRCPQALCDVSSEFVQANPRQLKKTVLSISAFNNRPLQCFGFTDMARADDHIEQQLSHMSALLAQGKIPAPAGKEGRLAVLFLGRYKNDCPKRLSHWRRAFADQLEIDFKTVHASKGLEAEYVYVLNLIEDRRGFPSQIEDDPVLQLAMPNAETFTAAEERRLFYVALTRASRQVRLYTSLTKPSRFVTELVSREQLVVEPVDGEALETCPKCGIGVVRRVTSGYAPFHACTTYPRCDFKRPIESTDQAPGVRLVTPVALDSACPTCGTGRMRLVNGKHGAFAGCSTFPKCRTVGPLA